MHGLRLGRVLGQGDVSDDVTRSATIASMGEPRTTKARRSARTHQHRQPKRSHPSGEDAGLPWETRTSKRGITSWTIASTSDVPCEKFELTLVQCKYTALVDIRTWGAINAARRLFVAFTLIVAGDAYEPVEAGAMPAIDPPLQLRVDVQCHAQVGVPDLVHDPLHVELVSQERDRDVGPPQAVGRRVR